MCYTVSNNRTTKGITMTKNTNTKPRVIMSADEVMRRDLARLVEKANAHKVKTASSKKGA